MIYTAVIRRHRCDHVIQLTAELFPVGFLLLLFFRDIGNENVIDPTVGLGLGEMAVIINPTDRAVLTDDAVLRIIHLFITGLDLLVDRVHDFLMIIRVQHAPEGVAGQLFKILQSVAAKDAEDGFVGIEKLLRLLRPVDEEAAGHVPADLLNDRNTLLIKLKMPAEHAVLLSD